MRLHVENKMLRSLITTICAPFRASTNRFLVLSALAAIAFCTGSAQAQTTQYASGAFTWGADSTWATASGGSYVNPWTSGNDAVLEGTAGTVSIAAGGVAAHNITFNKTGFTISANTLTLNGTTPTLSMEAGTNATISSIIAGSAGMTKLGAGTLTLSSNASTFTGDVNINEGTVIATGRANAVNPTASSLGNLAVARNINVNAGATLVVGASVNSDVLGSVNSAITATLVVDGGTVSNNGGNTVSTFNNITLKGGTLTGTGGQAKGAYMFNGTVTVAGTAASLITSGGTFNGYDLSNLAGVSRFTTFNVGDVATGPDLTISAVLKNGFTVQTTPSSLLKTGAGTLRLSAANEYTGTTTISNGTLQVDGSLASASVVTVVTSGTLSGTGTINGIVTNGVGGTLAPGGASIGTLTCNNTLTLLAGCTNAIQINKAGAVLTSDRVTGMTGVIYGGTLSVTATGDALAIGDTFTLFTKASGSYSGSFSVTNLPTLPDDREWNTSTLMSDGSIAVIAKGAQVPVLAPTFSPAPGVYFGAQIIDISCATAGSTIFYTTDGSTPTSTSPSGVAGSASALVSVPAPTNITIKAYATNSGMLDSTVSSATYSTVAGSTATWTNLVGGSWTVGGNWQDNAVGQGSGITADFSTLTLPANTAVSLGSALTIGNLIFGDVGNARTWTVNTDAPAFTLTLAGTGTPVITVSNQTTTIAAVLAGTNGMSKTGAGTLALSGANTFTGDLNINAGTLIVDYRYGIVAGPGGLGDSSVARNINIAAGATLQAGTVSANDTLGSRGNYTSSLIFNVNGGILSIGPAGSGTTWQDSVTTLNLNGGSVTNPSTSATSYLTLNGTVTVGGTAVSTMGATAGFYGLNNAMAGRNTTFNVGDVVTGPDLKISAPLKDGTINGTAFTASGLTKTGTGTLLLNTNSTYTGATTVSNGTLQVDGKIDSSDVTVMTNAVLCGTGTLGSNVTVNAGGILAAGTTNAVGNATAIAGALTLQDNSRLLVDVQSLSQNDLITVAGNVALTSAVKVEVSSGVTRSGTWTILQSTGGTISGTLPTTVSGAPKGATLSISADSKQLLLTFLPQGTLIRIF